MRLFSQGSLSGLMTTAIVLIATPSLADSTPVLDTISRYESRCSTEISVGYDSLPMRSPDGSTRVHVNGDFLKTSELIYPRRMLGSGPYCLHNEEQITFSAHLVIEQDGQVQEIDMTRPDVAYLGARPRSFSPDGRYLLASVNAAYSNGEQGSYMQLFDLEQGTSVSTPTCEGYTGARYYGVTPENEMIIFCWNGDSDKQVTALDLETLTVENLPCNCLPSDLVDHGTLDAETWDVYTSTL